jgi:H+/Cl- antiporter ClcA
MNNAVISIIIISVAIGFVATIIAGLIKLIFFIRQKDSYRQILKFGLLGEVIGLVTTFFVWYYCKSEINKWQEPEAIFAIPVYLMLFGLLVGTIITYSHKRKISKL